MTHGNVDIWARRHADPIQIHGYMWIRRQLRCAARCKAPLGCCVARVVCYMLRAAWCTLHAPCRTLAAILPCSMLHGCVACGTVARCTSYCTQSPGPSPWRAPRWLGQAASLRKSCIAASVVNMFGAPSVRVAVSASCAEQHTGISHRAACAAGCEGCTANRNKGA